MDRLKYRKKYNKTMKIFVELCGWCSGRIRYEGSPYDGLLICNEG